MEPLHPSVLQHGHPSTAGVWHLFSIPSLVSSTNQQSRDVEEAARPEYQSRDRSWNEIHCIARYHGVKAPEAILIGLHENVF